MFVVERHALGFTKIALRVFGYGVRLHLWHGAAPVLSRHNHGWSFVSIPLIGTFTDNRWRVANETGDTPRFIWSNKNRPDDPLTRTTASDALELIRTHTRYPLLPYRCKFGEIHSYYPSSRRFHVSLILMGRVKSATTSVWPL